MKKQRLEYIDTAKGILILLVVIGHIIDEHPVSWWFFTFHMPAFFIITGILLNHSSFLARSFPDALLSRIRALLIPYFAFEAFGSVVDAIITKGAYQNIKGYIFNSIILDYNNIVDWFLIHLLIAEMLFWLILRIKKQNVILLILGAVAVCSFAISQHFQLASRIGISLTFISLGYYAPKLFTSSSKWVMAAALAVSVLVTVLNGRVGMLTMRYNDPLLYLLGATAGTVFVLAVSEKLSGVRFLRFCGKKSLYIMGLHFPLLSLIRWMI